MAVKAVSNDFLALLQYCMFLFSHFQPMIAFVASLPYILCISLRGQPKQPFRGEKKNYLVKEDVSFLHSATKELPEGSLLPFLIHVS